MIDILALDIYEKKQISDYYSELDNVDRVRYLKNKSTINDELSKHGFDVEKTVIGSIRERIKNDNLMIADFLTFVLGTDSDNNTDPNGFYTFDNFVKNAIDIAKFTNCFLDSDFINDYDSLRIRRFVVRDLIFYKLYAICVFRSIQLNAIGDNPYIKRVNSVPDQQPTGYEPYYHFMISPTVGTLHTLMDWFTGIVHSKDLLGPLLDLFVQYMEDATINRNSEPQFEAFREAFNNFNVFMDANERAKNESISLSGMDKEHPVFETSSGYIVTGSINEDVLADVLDEVLSTSIESIVESQTGIKMESSFSCSNEVDRYTFDIPSQYKFALMTLFDDFKTATVLSAESEKFLIEDSNEDVYLLFMRDDDTLCGMSVNDTGLYKKMFVEFVDLDTDSGYECYLPDDDE